MYRMTEMVGKGSFGCVYKAIDVKTEKIFAIKITQTEKEHQSRELDLLLRLSHPNCIRLLDYYFFYRNNGDENDKDNIDDRSDDNDDNSEFDLEDNYADDQRLF